MCRDSQRGIAGVSLAPSRFVQVPNSHLRANERPFFAALSRKLARRSRCGPRDARRRCPALMSADSPPRRVETRTAIPRRIPAHPAPIPDQTPVLHSRWRARTPCSRQPSVVHPYAAHTLCMPATAAGDSCELIHRRQCVGGRHSARRRRRSVASLAQTLASLANVEVRPGPRHIWAIDGTEPSQPAQGIAQGRWHSRRYSSHGAVSLSL
jgi:hypothetical protein